MLPGTCAVSRLAALLLAQILPVFSLVAPCHPGASPPSVQRRTFTTDCPQPVAKVQLHSAGAASRLASLLLAQRLPVLPVFSLVRLCSRGAFELRRTHRGLGEGGSPRLPPAHGGDRKGLDD